MTTFTPTAPAAPATDIVAQAVAAGFFPPRHPVEVTGVAELTAGVVRLTFRDPYIAAHAKAAQFVDVFSPDPLKPMPRPFGVSEVEGDEVSVIFAVIGKGTADLAELVPGDMIDVMGPLGRPFNVKEPAHYVLVGGGLGVPPLIRTAQQLADRDDVTCTAVFGYRNERFADRIVGRYADTTLSISDAEGNVVTLLDRHEEALLGSAGKVTILACGPLPMMKAVAHWAAERGLACQLSMEQHMGCGYGTCVLCTVDTVDGRLKVCSDGPVFTRERLGWE
ncbi:dihydroorotate dehydrogenase electron transfer subunit [Bifidobacterium avesanii]|uniref:Dihydroorotate dehydrogenase electron transfer subunit n=1 Tax=Bifidobacterium avesanii TaxID=1798157 RepID=A0A7K3THU5_9BIFI|nr:dihydroorotate dehydrogenase electron transfer subunit [Bifidobacterium avesanii]KAB8293665.1 2-polyprenylphenol hydroxylase [Bifidobacterium avesanii]NEG78200.1 dihydroorotate dehydrogenase electron transfer subunit [Bifidobacterium avesanii]